MKSFDLFNRRIHLYLGLVLFPWLLLYGISSVLVSHNTWFRAGEVPTWQLLSERDYHRVIPDGAPLRESAHEILKDCKLEGAFWVQRPKPDEIRINRFSFWNDVRLVYSLKDQRLRVERQQLRWNQVLLRMHFRGGFQQAGLWDDLWAVLVDIVCLGIVVWIISGLIMWWRVARLRGWGAVALVGGALSFLVLLWRL